LYVRNLNDRIKLDGKIKNINFNIELKKTLFYLFQTYGEVIEINVQPTQKMRGQAFIVFRE
jgi:U2 small nuclear ribonucleoprotein B''